MSDKEEASPPCAVNMFTGALILNNNNNNDIVECSAAHNCVDGAEHANQLQRQSQSDRATAASTMAKGTTTTIGAVAVTPTCVAHVEDEGGGVGGADVYGAEAAALTAAAIDGGADKLPLNAAAAYATATASALTPTDAAVGGLSSSRTSMNNSTENLSYASDNYYPDDLILLDDDEDDVEAEEISLNSDDCVYAYRGDAADYDMAALDASTGRGGRSLEYGLAVGTGNLVGDDETEFLEMDFEPDPPSELDYGNARLEDAAHANLLLMQRDYSHLSGGRRSSTNMSLQATPTQRGRQLYSSPIDDLPPQEALQQQQQRLSKKFARISLNLDQINKEQGGSADEMPPAEQDKETAKAQVQSQSLPSTLYGSSFGRSSSEPTAPPQSSPSKVTGAKPKRLTTLSSSASASSSKQSSSSNKSSRRAFAPASFDERCYSCTDFRSSGTAQGSEVAPMLVAAAAVVAASAALASSAHFDLSGGNGGGNGSNEETCLDCLEKEFLANTIGKALDLSSCARCRKRAAGSSLSLYARAEQTRCRSGSPGFGNGLGLFGGVGAGSSAGSGSADCWPVAGRYNQRFISCDNNFGGMQLLQPSLPTEPTLLVARLSTAQLNESQLAQALDKLQISYNAALLHGYFQSLAEEAPQREHADLRQLLLHAARRPCNHRKLRRLIELASQQQVQVQFKQDTSCGATAPLVAVKVADILAHWKRHRDLAVLRQLDARFHRANVLGKIGHIVRQAQQQPAASTSSSTSTVPEFVWIPQYYACGELTLSRKC